MPEQKTVDIGSLNLDLANFRTMHQGSETEALQAMIATSPDRFWALMESLIADGYLPTETLLVLEGAKPKGPLTVKEGNRRVAAMKLIHGLLDRTVINIPESTERSIEELSKAWLKENRRIPCVVYGTDEKETVDKIVTLAHGKGEKAGRDQWNAVARARHNRDAQQVDEPALDLLEKYLENGKNLTKNQQSRWSGDYPLTVLQEAMKRIAVRLGFQNFPELAENYPSVTKKDALDDIMKNIGLKLLDFKKIRDKTRDFAAGYGIPPISEGKGSSGGAGKKAKSSKAGSGKQPRAASIGDSRSVKLKLNEFRPVGKGRAKLEALRIEAHTLSITKTPHAFCFVFRCMFELSAKAYCDDHKKSGGPSMTRRDGTDRSLISVLREITNHLTQNQSDKKVVKELHGALTELAKPDGLLSITSLNQLVHNPNFSILPTDICILFHNIFPLLEAMNE